MSGNNTSVRRRGTRSTSLSAHDMGSWIESAEEKRPHEMTIEERVEKRASGIYFNGVTLRVTEAQRDLLKFAAKRENTSVQKLIENLLQPYLEEYHGEAFDNQ